MAFERVPTWTSTFPCDAEVVDGTSAVAAEHAAGVGVVDHHDCTVLFRELGEFIDGADVAVHGEDAVSDDELAGRARFGSSRSSSSAVGDIFVAEDLDLGA